MVADVAAGSDHHLRSILVNFKIAFTDKLLSALAYNLGNLNIAHYSDLQFICSGLREKSTS